MNKIALFGKYKTKWSDFFMKRVNKKRFFIISLSIIIIFVVNIIIFINCSLAISKYGSRGSEVTTIQTKLKRWGYYNGAIDGIFRISNIECS